MTERATTIAPEAPEAEEQDRADVEGPAPRRRRRRPQFEKCWEAVDALRAQGMWPANQTRDEQYDRACAYLVAKGYAPTRLPSRPTFSKAMLARERESVP